MECGKKWVEPRPGHASRMSFVFHQALVWHWYAIQSKFWIYFEYGHFAEALTCYNSLYDVVNRDVVNWPLVQCHNDGWVAAVVRLTISAVP